MPIYYATKHAVLAFCTGNVKVKINILSCWTIIWLTVLQKYSEEGILLHCVCPGAVDTDMAKGAIAKGYVPQEVAKHLEPFLLR